MVGGEERDELSRQADPVAAREDAELVDRLRRGEAAAFADVVDRWSSMMLRAARIYAHRRVRAGDRPGHLDGRGPGAGPLRGPSPVGGGKSDLTTAFRDFHGRP
jgi:hypothetical protein